jgi:integrase
LSSGLRRQEFSYLLVYEVPALSVRSGRLPVTLAVPSGVSKGRKHRTTWIEPPALEAVHRYIGLDRAVSTVGSPWQPAPSWGEPLLISEADPLGGRVNGRRVRWDGLRPAQRRRLVAPEGGSPVLAVRADGGPFTAWESVFTRVSDRIRERFEPRFPHVHPHRLRHSFAMATLERLVGGYYEQAAGLVTATDTGAGPDAALSLYLSKADPMMVLRDLLGHSSVVTTEAYLRKLDMTRIYAEAYERSGLTDLGAQLEAQAEFDELGCDDAQFDPLKFGQDDDLSGGGY